MNQELLFSRSPGRHWAALREDGRLVELRVEDDGSPLAAGKIVKGRVSRVVAGIQAAFLDVGQEKDAFLHAADLLLPEETPIGDWEEGAVASAAGDDDDEDELGATPTPSTRYRRRNTPRAVPIEQRVREGRELLVQVAREEIGSKGPRVTSFVSLPGRYLVFLPQWSYLGVSRQIEDPAERSRLREILETLDRPGGGFIVRTAGQGRPKAAFEADAATLVASWAEIESRAEGATAPAEVHAGVDLPIRILRDARPDAVQRVVIDDPETYERARRYLAPLDAVLASRLELHRGPVPLFASEGIDAEIERALRPRVWLKSGGTIVIEPTEALVSIDVNTGRFVGHRRPEETILRTNLEAADEIARQLRLRDLGGIIVVDFIDMDRAESRKRVIEAFETALRRDRSRTKVVGLSELGLVQLTRKRTRPGLSETLTRSCPACGGQGLIKSPETLAAEALAEVRRLELALEEATSMTVRAHPDVARALRLALQGQGPGIDSESASRIVVEDDSAARPDQFDIRAR